MRVADLNDLRVFVRVVDRGTFAAAARELRVPTSTVSRTIARLEHQVGARLLQRTPRSVRATSEGHALYASVGEPLGALERAAHAVEPASRTPKGLLRVSAPVELAGTFLADVVVAFGERYPLVRVDIVVTNRAVNLIDDGLDLAIRAATKLADSSLVANKLGDLTHGLYASPRYLETHGTPASAADLAGHRCIVFRADDLAKTWRLDDAGADTAIELHAGLGADDFSSVRALAVAGGGIALMPRLVCAKDEAARRLVRILPRVSARGASVYLVYPSATHLPSRVTAFRTAVTSAFDTWRTADGEHESSLTMQAAVLHEPTGTPRYESFAEPSPTGDEVLVRVRAAGLHPLVRGHAGGKHYTSTGRYPLIPGIDGVCELRDGRLVYFSWPRAPYGTFAEQAAIAPASTLPIPAGLTAELAAGLVNPAMSTGSRSSCARMTAGERVVVLGATGASGRLAIQVARALGASHVVAVGRRASVLARLGADATLVLAEPAALRDDLARTFAAGVDIVLDYLWGPPAQAALDALLAAHPHLGTRRVRYVNIGEVAGRHVEISAHALRGMNLELSGSGFGSVSPGDIRTEIAMILDAAARGELAMDIEPAMLVRVAEAWTAGDRDGRRVVIVPS